MKKKILILSLTLFASVSILAKRGIDVVNKTGGKILVHVDKTTNTDWTTMTPTGKDKQVLFLTTDYGKRGVYWKVGKTTYKTPKYEYPDFLTIKPGGKFIMLEKWALGAKTHKEQQAESINDAQVDKERKEAAEKANLLTLAKKVNLVKAATLLTKIPALIKDIIKLIKDDEIEKSMKSVTTEISKLNKEIGQIKKVKGLDAGLKTTSKSIESFVKISQGLNNIIKKIKKLTDGVVKELIAIFEPGKETDKLNKMVKNIDSISKTVDKMLNKTAPKLIKAINVLAEEDDTEKTNEKLKKAIEKVKKGTKAIKEVKDVTKKIEKLEKIAKDPKVKAIVKELKIEVKQAEQAVEDDEAPPPIEEFEAEIEKSKKRIAEKKKKAKPDQKEILKQEKQISIQEELKKHMMEEIIKRRKAMQG